MLIALRDISIGEAHVKRGETISAELQRALPAGRVQQLKNARFVEEITDEASIAKQVDALTERVAALEAMATAPALTPVSDETPQRKPRQRKEAA